MRFRSLQSRILFFFLGLFALVQLVIFLSVTAANLRSVHLQIEEDLHLTSRIFRRFVQDRVEQLTLSVRLLSGDFAFKQAYANGDRDTLLSAVTNLQEHRIGSDVMILVDSGDYTEMVNTLRPASNGVSFPYPELIEAAEEAGSATSSVGTIEGRLHQLVVVPLLAPEPVAWIAVGFLIDDELAESFKQLTLTDVSFVTGSFGGGRTAVASTLPRLFLPGLVEGTAKSKAQLEQSFNLSLEGEEYVALMIELGDQLRVVLQRSLDRALEPFQRLYRYLVVLTVASLILLILGGVLIARTVTRPVRTLVASTRRIEKGDYQHQISIQQKDELGELADAFNQMTRGLAAFQRFLPTDLVRTLISKGIESKPQSRLATMLFTDIEGFTTMGEKMSPADLVNLLNEYFSTVSDPIEKYGGVIVQFQGDAILAVFNVPTDDPDHATNALRAALEIQKTVDDRTFVDGIKLRNRIGISTGDVVAGSVGSPNRVNYTVHGDAVNLAARLEALNKEYGTRTLVSANTAALIGDEFELERIDQVEIRGKRDATTMYTLT